MSRLLTRKRRVLPHRMRRSSILTMCGTGSMIRLKVEETSETAEDCEPDIIVSEDGEIIEYLDIPGPEQRRSTIGLSVAQMEPPVESTMVESYTGNGDDRCRHNNQPATTPDHNPDCQPCPSRSEVHPRLPKPSCPSPKLRAIQLKPCRRMSPCLNLAKTDDRMSWVGFERPRRSALPLAPKSISPP